MNKSEIKKKLAEAVDKAMPGAIKDHARWKAGDAVREAIAPPPGDDDSGEYPPVTTAGTPQVPIQPPMVNGIRVNYKGPSRK